MQASISHNLRVEPFDDGWQIVAMDSGDKNGGPNNLRAWREAKGWTQAELAERVEPPTTANMIQYLETGERGLSLKWLRRLADALGTTSGHLADHAPESAREIDELEFWMRRMDKQRRHQLGQIAKTLASTGTDDN